MVCSCAFLVDSTFPHYWAFLLLRRAVFVLCTKKWGSLSPSSMWRITVGRRRLVWPYGCTRGSGNMAQDFVEGAVGNVSVPNASQTSVWARRDSPYIVMSHSHVMQSAVLSRHDAAAIRI